MEGPLFRPYLAQEGNNSFPPGATRLCAPLFELPEELLAKLVICVDQDLAKLLVGDQALSCGFFSSPAV
jgi:hypothetical protein